MGRILAYAQQHDTHSDLVAWPEGARLPFMDHKLDAIIVPASRSAANLDHAVTLARAAHCLLVLICSGRALADEITELLAARSFDEAIVIDMPRDYRHRFLDLSTTQVMQPYWPGGGRRYNGDLSTKRNIGLLLSRMLSWERIFFLDDDIRDISYPDLLRTVAMVGPAFDAAGMRVASFPDNSIACHAHRHTGGHQDVFVTGAALAVNSEALTSFFPDIYNEDWLFFYDSVREGRLASSGLMATQLLYDPFSDPERAAWQEFGDVMAEGMYGALHRASVPPMTAAYWRQFIRGRQQFLESIVDRRGEAPDDLREKIVAAVESSMKSLARIEPEMCERFYREWRSDLEWWRFTLRQVPRMTTPRSALAELGLLPTSTCLKGTGRFARPYPIVPETAPPGPVRIPCAPTTELVGAGIGAPQSESIARRTGDTVPLPTVPPQPGKGRHRKAPDNSPFRRGLSLVTGPLASHAEAKGVLA